MHITKRAQAIAFELRVLGYDRQTVTWYPDGRYSVEVEAGLATPEGYRSWVSNRTTLGRAYRQVLDAVNAESVRLRAIRG